MKTRITLIATLYVAFFFTMNAAVLTVSNSPLGGSQYNSLAAAYNAASNGDTLIFEGTNIEYSWSGLSWNKQLTVLGGGINTDKENFKKTIIYGQWGGLAIEASGSGSSFYGITFYFVALNLNANTITFENCEFIDRIVFSYNNNGGSVTCRNCIFNSDNNTCIELPSSVVTTVSLFNCVFDGNIYGKNNNLNTLLVDHCLFLSTSSAFLDVNSAIISNSIFMNAYPSSITNATFLNNICRVAGIIPPAGNSGSGNIENTDPLLASYTLNSFYSSSHDYDLQAGSPCELAGSDGTDIGVHGGASNFSEQGEPLIAPVVRSVIITTPVVSANGTLSVDVTASKPAEE